MHVHWKPARDSMGASLIRGLRWRERCRWVGFAEACGSSWAQVFAVSSELAAYVPAHLLAWSQFSRVHPWRIFTDFLEKQQWLVQAKSAHPNASTQIDELMLSHRKKKFSGTQLLWNYRQTDGNINRKLQSMIRYENMQWNLCGIHTRAMNHPAWILILQYLTW